MKKNLLLLAFLLSAAVSTSLMAQISVGFKAAPLVLNSSKMVGTYENITDGKTAEDYDAYSPLLNLGITLKYTYENSFSLASEFTYKMQGFQDKSEEKEFKLDYIEIPLLAGYSYGDKTKIFVQAGPSVKFLTRAKYSSPDIYNTDIKSSMTLFKPVVLVANLGFGISRQINESISLNAEYRIGYDLTRTVGDTSDNDTDYYGTKHIQGDKWTFSNAHLVQSALTIGVSVNL